MSNYSKDDITILKGLDAIRKRPAMFIGDLKETGFKNLINETVLFLILNYKPSQIEMELFGDGKYKMSIDSEVKSESDVLNSLEGLLREKGPLGQEMNMLPILNVLSSEMNVVFYSNGQEINANYKEGKCQSKSKNAGKKEEFSLTFSLDKTILTVTEIDFVRMQAMIYSTCCLFIKGMSIKLTDHQNHQSVSLQIKNGLSQIYNLYKAFSWQYSHTPQEIILSIDENEFKADILLDIDSFRYSRSKQASLSYVNGRRTTEDGSHVQGIIDGITKARQKYSMEIRGISTDSFEEDIRCQVIIVVSVWMETPAFIGSTRTKFNSVKVHELLAAKVEQHILKLASSDVEVARFLTPIN